MSFRGGLSEKEWSLILRLFFQDAGFPHLQLRLRLQLGDRDGDLVGALLDLLHRVLRSLGDSLGLFIALKHLAEHPLLTRVDHLFRLLHDAVSLARHVKTDMLG